MIPAVMYFECLSYTNYMGDYNYQYIKQSLANTIAGAYVHDIIAVILAVLFAITGNAWNNSQKKNDFYKALPVKENTRFVYIHLNSFISFILCFGINLIFANLIVACYKFYETTFVVASLYSLLIHSLEFMAVYMLSVIAQYLTGNAVLAVLGTGILLSAETVIRILMDLFKSENYKTYVNMYHEFTEFFYKAITSPVAGALAAHESISRKYDDYYIASNYSEIWPGVIKTVVQIVIFTVIAFYIYKARPAQAGNKNIVFDKTKAYIKCLIMIPLTSVCVLLFMENDNGAVVPKYIGMILALVISHIILQYAIEGDFAAVKKGYISTIISGAIVTAIMVFYSISGVNYDRYKPVLADVESLGICTGEEYDYNFSRGEGIYSYISSSDYFFNDVKLTDETFIKETLEIISKNIDNGTYCFDDEWTKNQITSGIDISFNLKNGKQISRSYTLPQEDCDKIKYAMYDLDEYKHASNQLEYPGNIKCIESAEYLTVVYRDYGKSNNDTCTIDDKELQKKMLEAVSQDYLNRSSEVYTNELPIGYICIDVYAQKRANQTYEYKVYAGDTDTLAILSELNYEFKSIDLSKITSIELIKYNYSEASELNEKRVTLNQEDDLFEEVRNHLVNREAYYNSRLPGKYSSIYDICAYAEDGSSIEVALKGKDEIKGLEELFQ